jgi:hypothetical protein
MATKSKPSMTAQSKLKSPAAPKKMNALIKETAGMKGKAPMRKMGKKAC